jgi:hypothetical protein
LEDIKMDEQQHEAEARLEAYKELLSRAYKLLDDINQPFRNVERYDVQKWLEDAKQVLEVNYNP